MSTYPIRQIVHFITGLLIVMLLAGGLAAPVAADEPGEPSEPNGPIGLVVQVAPGADCLQLAADYGADLLGAVAPLSLCRLQMDGLQAGDSLAADPRVVTVEEDEVLEAQPRYVGADGADDIMEAQPHYIGAHGGPGPDYHEQWAVGRIRAPQAQALTTGQGVIVAVLDTGVDLNHPLLEGKLMAGYDFVDGDDDPSEETDGIDNDGNGRVDEAVGHGTHIAGIVALVAPDATIMPVRIFDSDGQGTYFDAIEGIVYAVDHGAQVINLSGSGPNSTEALQAAVNYAWDNGVLLVTSGGVNSLGYPALYEHVISVGASDQEDRAADFAVFQEGPPTVYAPGISIFSAYTDGTDYPDQYACAWWSGNSMATPFVAGEAALLFSSGDCDRDCVTSIIPDTKFPEVDNGEAGRIDLYDAAAAALGTTDVELQLQYHSNSSADNEIHPVIQIINEGNTIPFSELTMRYWYTGGDAPYTLTCQQADVGCEHTTSHVVKLNPHRFKADQYLEIGFASTAGYLLGGREGGSVANQILRIDGGLYDEFNDYSFKPTEMPSAWDRVTLYHQGTLVWGKEPRLAILVVDDDLCQPYGAYYEQALNTLGKSYDYWNICLSGAPALADLEQYNIVIWFTGNDYQTTLTYADRANLAAYLDNGGRLFISGQNIDYHIGNQAFFSDYLHAIPAWYNTNVYGLTGYDLMQGLNVNILGGDGANNQANPAGVNLRPGAVGLFNYGGGYGWGGLRWEGDYKVVYLSFGFEAINTAAARVSVMDRILTWLEGEQTQDASNAIFFDDFETSKGWIRNYAGTDTATSGLWQRAIPQQTSYQGWIYQVGATTSGSHALVTGALAGTSPGSYDVDDGKTSARSPAITLPNTGNLTLSFNYYLAHHDNATSDDYLRVTILGQTTETVLEKRGSPTRKQALWTSFSVPIDQFAGQTIYLLIEAADEAGPSLIEAGVDDVMITQ